jgi:hypothetical protein
MHNLQNKAVFADFDKIFNLFYRLLILKKNSDSAQKLNPLDIFYYDMFFIQIIKPARYFKINILFLHLNVRYYI